MATAAGRRWLLAAAAAAMVLFAAEFTARAQDYFRFGLSFAAAPDFNRDLKQIDEYGLRGRPYGRFDQWRLNSAGFHGPEVPMQRRPGCSRIMLLGASETFGNHEREGKEYPAQLADSLKPFGCVEVINAALAGSTLADMTQLWNYWAWRFKPDVVLLYPSPTFHYLGTSTPGYPAPPEIRRKERDVVAPWWTPRLLQRLRDRVDFPDAVQRRRVQRAITRSLAGRGPSYLFESLPAERMALFAQHLDSLVTAIQNRGATPVLVTHAMRFPAAPTPEDADLLQSWRVFVPRATPATILAFERAAADSTRALGRRRGLVVVDADRVLSGREYLFADQVHFTEEGSGVMAGEIMRTIRTAPPSHPLARVAGSEPSAAPRAAASGARD